MPTVIEKTLSIKVNKGKVPLSNAKDLATQITLLIHHHALPRTGNAINAQRLATMQACVRPKRPRKIPKE